ncbi:hypothetical protein DFH09DRAFT_1094209 [Mycena vulgaris]|nr:hypothetical protein DFH09DRAFT_1094209 [Mycena vulgaris]
MHMGVLWTGSRYTASGCITAAVVEASGDSAPRLLLAIDHPQRSFSLTEIIQPDATRLKWTIHIRLSLPLNPTDVAKRLCQNQMKYLAQIADADLADEHCEGAVLTRHSLAGPHFTTYNHLRYYLRLNEDNPQMKGRSIFWEMFPDKLPTRGTSTTTLYRDFREDHRYLGSSVGGSKHYVEPDMWIASLVRQVPLGLRPVPVSDGNGSRLTGTGPRHSDHICRTTFPERLTKVLKIFRTYIFMAQCPHKISPQPFGLNLNMLRGCVGIESLQSDYLVLHCAGKQVREIRIKGPCAVVCASIVDHFTLGITRNFSSGGPIFQQLAYNIHRAPFKMILQVTPQISRPEDQLDLTGLSIDGAPIYSSPFKAAHCTAHPGASNFKTLATFPSPGFNMAFNSLKSLCRKPLTEWTSHCTANDLVDIQCNMVKLTSFTNGGVRDGWTRQREYPSPAVDGLTGPNRHVAGSPEGEIAKKKSNKERMREVQRDPRGTQEIYKKSKSNGSVHIHSAFSEVKVQHGAKLTLGSLACAEISVFAIFEDSPAQQPVVKLRVMPVTFGSGGVQEAGKGGKDSKISFYSAILPVDGRNGCNGRDPSVGPSWLSPRRTGDPRWSNMTAVFRPVPSTGRAARSPKCLHLSSVVAIDCSKKHLFSCFLLPPEQMASAHWLDPRFALKNPTVLQILSGNTYEIATHGLHHVVSRDAES